MDFRAWITALITPDTLRTASEKIGLSHSTVTRQLSRDTLTPTTVIALCRAYGRSPVDGLVQTGYLRDTETDGVGVAAALDIATNRQLLDEVLRRSDPDSQYLFGRGPGIINPAGGGGYEPTEGDEDAGNSDVGGSGPSDLKGLSDHSEPSASEVNRPRGHSANGEDGEGTVADWVFHSHAADGSVDEDRGREDAGSDPLN